MDPSALLADDATIILPANGETLQSREEASYLYDFTLFLRHTNKGTILLLIYVDDMIIIGDDLSVI